MREPSLQIALMLMGVAVVGYAGCSVDPTTGGIITTGAFMTGDFTSSSSSLATSGSTTGSGMTSGSTSSGSNGDNIGFQCEADADCGGDLKCLTAGGDNAILGGGAANGYCSKDCAKDTDCPGASSICIGAAAGKPGICLLACEIGPELTALNAPLDEAKCFGREDVRCAAFDDAGMIAGCVPTCGRDDQCPAGRFCDQRSEVCVAKASAGLPIGDKCDPMATTPQCAGTCFSFGGGETTCSSPCVLGGDFSDLAAVADCGGLDKGICAYSPAGAGAGDFGICAEACKLHSDCQNPGFWCNNVGVPGNGYCFGADACPKGQADCKSPDVCTETKYGPFCLDTSIPLGDAAPGGSSSSSAASSSSASSSAASSSAASSSSASSSSASSSSASSGAGGGSSSAASTGSAGGAGGAGSTTASTGP